MKIFEFTPAYKYGGKRVTISRSLLELDKIESLQFLDLTPDLKEPYHLNQSGRVVCIVVEGWMEMEVDTYRYTLKKGQGILVDEGERHRVTRGEGIMLSIASEDHELGLSTIWGQNALA